jgi:hypothetical protein
MGEYEYTRRLWSRKSRELRLVPGCSWVGGRASKVSRTAAHVEKRGTLSQRYAIRRAEGYGIGYTPTQGKRMDRGVN